MHMKTWLDLLPEEILHIIWKNVNKTVMEDVVIFGRYKLMYRLGITGPPAGSGSYVRIRGALATRMPRCSKDMPVRYIEYDNGDRCPFAIYTYVKGLSFVEPDACGLLRAPLSLPQLYQLCKVIDNDWKYIGFVENLKAKRFTYNEPDELMYAVDSFN